MASSYKRHDISDEKWVLLEPMLPGRKRSWGGIAKDNRQFINAVFWILRTGAPWRDLPEEYGDWKNTHRRFCRWRDKGVWEKTLEALIEDPDYDFFGGMNFRENLSSAPLLFFTFLKAIKNP